MSLEPWDRPYLPKETKEALSRKCEENHTKLSSQQDEVLRDVLRQFAAHILNDDGLVVKCSVSFPDQGTARLNKLVRKDFEEHIESYGYFVGGVRSEKTASALLVVLLVEIR